LVVWRLSYSYILRRNIMPDFWMLLEAVITVIAAIAIALALLTAMVVYPILLPVFVFIALVGLMYASLKWRRDKW
jgi:hypothetical protein